MLPERRIGTHSREWAQLTAGVERAFGLVERLNRLPYSDQDAIRAAFAELTGTPVDETLRLVPPFRSDHGLELRVGRRVFINHDCTINDLGGVDIGDTVMIGPNVQIITSGHPTPPAERRAEIVMAPIRIERGVWIGAGATVLQGVTVGADAVVAAGAVVTRDVPPATLAAGVPARVVKELAPPPSAGV
jgi:acetyltransferase-like isoleucine patch superfamily enzyme